MYEGNTNAYFHMFGNQNHKPSHTIGFNLFGWPTVKKTGWLHLVTDPPCSNSTILKLDGVGPVDKKKTQKNTPSISCTILPIYIVYMGQPST